MGVFVYNCRATNQLRAFFLFHRYLVSTYYMLDIVLGAKDIEMNKISLLLSRS